MVLGRAAIVINEVVSVGLEGRKKKRLGGMRDCCCAVLCQERAPRRGDICRHRWPGMDGIFESLGATCRYRHSVSRARVQPGDLLGQTIVITKQGMMCRARWGVVDRQNQQSVQTSEGECCLGLVWGLENSGGLGWNSVVSAVLHEVANVLVEWTRFPVQPPDVSEASSGRQGLFC